MAFYSFPSSANLFHRASNRKLCLRCADVTFTKEAATSLYVLKNNRFKGRRVSVLIPFVRNSSLCSVTAIKAMLRITIGCERRQFAFFSIAEHSVKTYVGPQVNAILQSRYGLPAFPPFLLRPFLAEGRGDLCSHRGGFLRINEGPR